MTESSSDENGKAEDWRETLRRLEQIHRVPISDELLRSMLPEGAHPIAYSAGLFNWDRGKKLRSGCAFLTEDAVVLWEFQSGTSVTVSLGEWLWSYEHIGLWTGSAHVLRRGDQELRFQPGRFPLPEWLRIVFALTGDESVTWGNGLENLSEEWPRDPGALPIDWWYWDKGIGKDPTGQEIESVLIYDDRLIVNSTLHLPFVGEVIATVDTSGGITAVRGRNLADKAIGTAAFGLLGAAFAGNAQIEEVDSREQYIFVEADDWVYSHEVEPEARQLALEFASTINRTARKFTGAPVNNESRSSNGGGLASELKELADLHQSGILTDEEFAAAKRKLIG